MSRTRTDALNVLCLASYFKGVDFLRECKRQGARIFLITRERTLDEDWPREIIDEIVTLPNDASVERTVYTAAQVARHHRLDRVVALEEFDVLAAALLREHLCFNEGMSSSTARRFRDKLNMRVRASEAKIPAPPFVHALNFNALGEYMARVPAPWVLKPRADVSAFGIKKLDDSEQVWRAIDALDARPAWHEQSSSYLLEAFIPGDVFHVDSLVNDGEVVFAGTNRYGRPPMEVSHAGGAYLSYTVEHDSKDQKKLFQLNRKLLKSLGLRRGAAHAEFIKGASDGRFYFLEVAARVGGAYTAENLEAASGVNLWREWAKIELQSDGENSYEPPTPRREYAGLVLSLARQEHPDTSRYDDPEIAYRVSKAHHAGLIVRSTDQARVKELLATYARRFADDFIAVVPPPERAE